MMTRRLTDCLTDSMIFDRLTDGLTDLLLLNWNPEVFDCHTDRLVTHSLVPNSMTSWLSDLLTDWLNDWLTG